MARLYLVRHGRAAATFAEAADPGLDALGKSQASAAADRLAPLGPLLLFSSPLKRARETSEPLSRRWKRDAQIEAAVSEIPSPPGLDLSGRAEWLRSFMAGTWRSSSRELARWREEVIAALTAFEDDAVIFSHFIAINVAVGAAEGDERVTVFRPDNCSVTILDAKNGALELIGRGHEAETRVN